MQRVTTLAELDRKLQECRAAAEESDAALRAVFAGFEGCFALDHPADPLGDDYRRFQMALYERFARRPYSTANEATPFDLDASVTRPFPFDSESTVTAGQHLGAVAFLLRCLSLEPGARVLEFGPGWGNTTIALAQLGFAVTAVEVDPRFCELLRRRARQSGVAVEVVNADFFWAEQAAGTFDAVIFFECFHHCADHLRLLRALHRVVRGDGRVYFGAEPILAEYPVPWGLRMDGEALWAIGVHGWLELGFREGYFRAALNRTGWIGRPARSADLPWISVWEASACSAEAIVVEAADRRLGTLTGHKVDGRIRIAAGLDGYGLYGPHVPLAAGAYRGTVWFAPGAALSGEWTMDICGDRGAAVLVAAAVDVEAARRSGATSLDFELAEQVDEIEVRLFSRAGAVASIDRVVIAVREMAGSAGDEQDR